MSETIKEFYENIDISNETLRERIYKTIAQENEADKDWER